MQLTRQHLEELLEACHDLANHFSAPDKARKHEGIFEHVYPFYWLQLESQVRTILHLLDTKAPLRANPPAEPVYSSIYHNVGEERFLVVFKDGKQPRLHRRGAAAKWNRDIATACPEMVQVCLRDAWGVGEDA